jgi:membrane-associated phospholipid phosphatase
LTEILNKFFEFITVFAEQVVMMVVIGYLFWCTERSFGFKFILTTMSGFSVNGFFKNLFRVERPFVINKDIKAIRTQTATGYSFPSGHTQTATMVYGPLGIKKRGIILVLSAVFIFLIGVSRVYLKVHTVYDVLGGLAVGIIWSFFSFKLYDYLEKKNNPFLFLIYIIPAILSLLTVNLQFPGDTFSLAGSTIGAVLGVVFENKYVNFNPKAFPKIQVLKMAIGLIVALIIQSTFKQIDKALIINHPYYSYFAELIGYIFIGSWITLGMPILCKKYFSKDIGD